MARFIVRIELHGAGDVDYAKLHGMMEREGFSRTTNDGGIEYHLPPAEYEIVGGYTAAAVKEKAIHAALLVGKTCGIVANEVLDQATFGLVPVSKLV